MRPYPMIAALCGLLALGAVGGPAATAQTKPAGPPLDVSVLVATPAFYDLPVYALTKVGADYGIKLNMVETQGGGDTGTIFAGGQGDILMAGIDKAFGFKKQGVVDAKIVGVVLTAANWSLVVPAKSKYQTVQDLKGSTIGISGPGSSSDLLVRWASRKVGLDPAKDLQLIALGSVASLYAGLENERVNAAVLVSPFLEKATGSGMGRVVGDWEGMAYPNNVFMARTSDLKANPEKAKRFMAAMHDILQRFQKDRPFALSIAKARYPRESEETLNRQLDHAIKVLWAPMDGILSEKLYDNARDVMVGSGRLVASDIPPYADLVSNLVGQ
ncbi:ABC transporter substrate-binding protein [Bosea sp. BK604]|uniref:ABC transporter substrate-binding protein n=1 Tax=Bosea sp. BK604 TaxID=2512180 RepID=UPI00104B4915|nr:ABC transporter substrate-binding protein [Bosea sp. BK604]TCR70662.1 ABC-type nitrate/sulfonate/bicarbonate transport system substrate-binding protein [Bosea sp. BK604]